MFYGYGKLKLLACVEGGVPRYYLDTTTNATACAINIATT